MSYIVNRTDGNIAAVVNNGVIDTTTSLKLVGKGYPDYAETIAEDLVALLENFSGPLAPNSPLPGQLWYLNTLEKIQLFNGTQFKLINNVNSSASSPVNPVNGDFWYNTTTDQLFYYRNDDWRLIAPSYTPEQGHAELVVETFKDDQGNDHTGIVFYVDDFRVAIISHDAEYTTYPYMQGYPTIKPGINIGDSNLITDALLNGTATRALSAAGLEAAADANYMHANANTSTIGNLTVSNSKFTLGTSGNLVVNTSSNISVTAVANSPMVLNGFGGSSLTLDNATNWIAINKSTPTVDLDVGGAINADEEITAVQGYYFGDSSSITSTGNEITISAGGALQTLLIMNTGNVEVLNNLSANNVSTTNDISVGGNLYTSTIPLENTQATNKDYVDTVVLNNSLPIGTIVMWYGAALDVPAGWTICNGTNGTPDLRDKFVIGAGTSVGLGQSGGNSYVAIQTNTAGSHNHTGTSAAAGDHDHSGNTDGHALTASEVAGHTHNFSDLYGLRDDANPPVYDRNGNRLEYYTGWGSDGDADSGSGIFREWQTDSTGDSAPHIHPISNSGTHTHTITVQTNGSHYHEFSFDNRPAFVGIYYIMRTANVLNPYS